LSNVVPVKYDRKSLSRAEIAVIKKVHRNMNKLIQCIRFVPFSSVPRAKSFLTIRKASEGNGKSATVFYPRGNAKEMEMVIKFYEVNDTSYNRMVLTHESLHTLGLGHTHMRSDRDEHIRLNDHNIKAEKKRQYQVCKSCNLHVLHDIPYDCGSIMHYRRCRYGVEPCDDPKFEPLDPNNCNVVDMNFEMSDSDIKSAQILNCNKEHWTHKNEKNRFTKKSSTKKRNRSLPQGASWITETKDTGKEEMTINVHFDD